MTKALRINPKPPAAAKTVRPKRAISGSPSGNGRTIACNKTPTITAIR
jgi:hypothetical protein